MKERQKKKTFLKSYRARRQPSLTALRFPTLAVFACLMLFQPDSLQSLKHTSLLPGMVFAVLFGPELLPEWLVRIIRKVTWLPIWFIMQIFQYVLTVLTYPFHRDDEMQFHVGENIGKLVSPQGKKRSISPLGQFSLSQNFFVVLKELFLYNFQHHKHMRLRRQFFKFSDGGIITLDWHMNLKFETRQLDLDE